MSDEEARQCARHFFFFFHAMCVLVDVLKPDLAPPYEKLFVWFQKAAHV